MSIIRIISRSRLYLKISGFHGFSRAVIATIFKFPTVIDINRTYCRFPFRLRFTSSDIDAFEQIFVGNEYDFLVETQPKVIVDAGANIGLTSIYFANRYPEAKIIAIEPEQSNFELLKENVAPYANIIPLRAALWHKNEEIDLVDPGRGKWGFMTQNSESDPNPVATLPGSICHKVKAITVDRLMGEYKLDRINILKIDIEGAEKEVFSDTTSWIDKVDCIVVELHDRIRPGCVDSFCNGTKGFDHEWLQGEKVILTKGNWLTRHSA